MPGMAPGGFCAAAGFCDAQGRGTVPAWATRLAVALPFGLDLLVLHIARLPLVMIDWALPRVPFLGACSLAGNVMMAFWVALAGWANQWVKGGFMPAVRALEYSRDFACPTRIMSTATAVANHLRGMLSIEETVDYGAANGDCPQTVFRAVNVSKVWYTVEVQWKRFLRGILRTEDDLRREWKRVGMIDDAVQTAHMDAMWIPLDRGTILDALIRLRPGRNPQGITYTEVDARRDLRRLGYEDRSIDILIALNVRPPMHRIIVSGFEKGTIQEDILMTALQDEGMDPYYVSSLMDTYKRIRTHTLRAEMGAPAASQLVKETAAGRLTPSELAAELKQWGLPPQEIAAGEAEAQAQTLRDIRAAGITSVRAGYQTGQLGSVAADAEMIAFGLDGPTRSRLLQLWTLEAQARRHPDSPATLCQWATKGVIEVREMRERLLLQGYTPLQVAYMVDACTLKERERAQAVAAKDATAREKRAVANVKAVESLVRRLAREAAAKEKAAGAGAERHAASIIGEVAREAHEIHTAEHAAESAGKPPAVRAAETLPQAAADQVAPPPAG